MEIFLKNLEKVRLRWGLKKGELSQMLGYNQKAFSAVLHGRVNPSLEMLMRLEVKTGISALELLTQEISMKEIPKPPFARDIIKDENGYRVVSLDDSGQIIEDPGVPYESKYERLEKRVGELERRLDNLTDTIDRLLNQKL